MPRGCRFYLSKAKPTVNESANDTQDSSNSQSGELILYSTVTHERISTRPYNVNHPTSVAFSPATNTLVVGHHDGSIDLWTGDKFQMRQRLDDQHQDKVVAIAFLSSGEFFATAGADQRVMLWSYDENGVVWKSSENLGFGILSLSFNSEGMLAVAGHAAKIVLIEATEEPRDPIPWHNSWVISLSFSPTEPNLLAVGSLDSYFFRCERRRCNSSSYARRRDADIALLDIA